MFKKFKKEAPTLEIDRDGFALVTMGMGIRERFLQDAIFNKFDTNRSGSIDFTVSLVTFPPLSPLHDDLNCRSA